METVPSWLAVEPFRSIFEKIRSSLSHVTRIQCEDDEEDASTATTGGPKLRLECGSAKYLKGKIYGICDIEL
jgi:hypothetical protein